MNEQNDIRETLIAAAEKLIRGGRKAGALTSREIAAAAGVSAGLVNYHFGSKDALVEQAAGRIFADFVPGWEKVLNAALEAAEKERAAGREEEAGKASLEAGSRELKLLLKSIARAVDDMPDASAFMLRRELMEGSLDTVRFLAPALRTILPEGTDERQIRWASFFIVAPLQLMFLRREWFCDWTGSSITREEDRAEVMDFLIDRILTPFGK